MPTLTRYLVLGVLVRTSLSLVLLLAVYAVFDLIELGALSPLKLSELILFYIYKVPTIISQLLPLTLALGVSLTISALKRHREWTALYALGVPCNAIIGRLLVIPAVSVGCSLFLTEELSPRALSALYDRQDNNTQEDTGRVLGWIKHDRWLLQLDGQDRVRTAIGFPTADRSFERYEADSSAGATYWSEKSGWEPARGRFPKPPPLPMYHRRLTAPLGTLQGAVLTRESLTETIVMLARMGLDTAPLEAERALRIALAIAALLIPIATLLFNLGFRDDRGPVLLGQAIAATVLYWMFTAILWNGVSLGIWSGSRLAFGAPLLFAAATAAIAAALKRRHRSGKV